MMCSGWMRAAGGFCATSPRIWRIRRCWWLATARDDGENRAAVEAFSAELGEVIDTRVDLGPLDEVAVGQLLSALLGGAGVTAQLTAQLAARGGGNPFTLGEYLWAAVDAGVIRPSWGVWVLEEGGLDALELPADVLDLVLSRIDGLGLDSRRVLAAAAAIGMRFGPDRLAEVCQVDQLRVLEVIRVADRPAAGRCGRGRRVRLRARPDPGGAAGRPGRGGVALVAPAHRHRAGGVAVGRVGARVRGGAALQPRRDRPCPAAGV